MCQQLANEHLRMHSPHRADGGGLVNRHRSRTGVVKHAEVVGETMIHHRRCHAATGAITRGGVFGLADSAERQVSTMPASRSMIVLGSDSTVPVSCCGGVQCVAMTPCRYSASTAASDDCDSVRRTLTAQSRCGPNPLTLAPSRAIDAMSVAVVSAAMAVMTLVSSTCGSTHHVTTQASALDNSARAPHSASLRTIGASVGSVSDKSARWSGSFTDSSVRRGSSSSSDVSRHAQRGFVRSEQRRSCDARAHDVGYRREQRGAAGAFISGPAECEMGGAADNHVAQQPGRSASTDRDAGIDESRDEDVDIGGECVA